MQVKPEYEPIKEFREMALKLVNKFPDVLDGINPNVITCVGITNKEPKEDDQDGYEIKAVPYPIRMDCPYDFYVIVNMKVWDGFNNRHKAVLVMKALCRISREGDGKVLPYDLKDHAIMVRTLGVDYLKRADIPDIINDAIEWKKE